jgi:hypothetical protein
MESSLELEQVLKIIVSVFLLQNAKAPVGKN